MIATRRPISSSRALREAGATLVMHGLTHRMSGRAWTPAGVLRAHLFARGQGEFHASDAAETHRRLDEGAAILRRAGLEEAPPGLRPPGVAAVAGRARRGGRAGVRFLRALQRHHPPGNRHARRVIGWGSLSALEAAATSIYADLQSAGPASTRVWRFILLTCGGPGQKRAIRRTVSRLLARLLSRPMRIPLELSRTVTLMNQQNADAPGRFSRSARARNRPRLDQRLSAAGGPDRRRRRAPVARRRLQRARREARLELPPANPNEAAPLPFDPCCGARGSTWRYAPSSGGCLRVEALPRRSAGDLPAGGRRLLDGRVLRRLRRALQAVLDARPGDVHAGALPDGPSRQGRPVARPGGSPGSRRPGRITTTIFNGEFPRDVYAYGSDSLPMLLFALRAADATHLIDRHRALLAREIDRYVNKVFDPELGMARADGYFSGPAGLHDRALDGLREHHDRACSSGCSTSTTAAPQSAGRARHGGAARAPVLDGRATSATRSAEICLPATPTCGRSSSGGDRPRDAAPRLRDAGRARLHPAGAAALLRDGACRRRSCPSPESFTPNYQGDPSWMQLGARLPPRSDRASTAPGWRRTGRRWRR